MFNVFLCALASFCSSFRWGTWTAVSESPLLQEGQGEALLISAAKLLHSLLSNPLIDKY